jgi:hypothetical protein
VSKIADKDSGCIHAQNRKLYPFEEAFVEELQQFNVLKKNENPGALIHLNHRSGGGDSDIKFVRKSGLGLFHHHFAFVIKLSFVPMSAVEEVRLSSSWACCNLRSSQCIVCSTLSRPCLTLASFGMCHDGLFQIFQCVPTRVYVIVFIFSIAR